MNQPATDRRRFPRVKCNLPVKIRRMEDPAATVPSDTRREFSMTAVNLSQGGICLHSAQPIGSNDLYRISIDIPGLDVKVTAFGEVIWSGEQKGGIHFLAIHEDQENHLKDFVSNNISSFA
jgi:c-di-GMP-binding flagellar brake protein YcgR